MEWEGCQIGIRAVTTTTAVNKLIIHNFWSSLFLIQSKSYSFTFGFENLPILDHHSSSVSGAAAGSPSAFFAVDKSVVNFYYSN